MSQAPDWSEGFQRTILRLAIDSDLPLRVPGAFKADLFGPVDGALSPRVRIAQVIERYWKSYAAPSTLEQMGELIGRMSAEMPSGLQQTEIFREWEEICTTARPEDPSFAIHEIKGWAEKTKLIQALLQAADGIENSTHVPEAVKDVLEHALTQISVETPETERAWRAESESRQREWRLGLDKGNQVPTGLKAFDEAISGGPRIGETWYVIGGPKGGKTTTLGAITLGAMKRRHGGYYVSYEMQADRVFYRMDRAITASSREELRQDDERLGRMMRGLGSIGAGEIWVCQSSPMRASTVQATARRIDKLRQKGAKIDLVVFDYLNIMGSGQKEREKRHELSLIAREMSAFAKQEGVVVWSAALARREAFHKAHISRTDIAEAFEVIAVLDGAVAVCGDRAMRDAGVRALYITAAREEGDEKNVGYYRLDRERMTMTPLNEMEAEAWAMRTGAQDTLLGGTDGSQKPERGDGRPLTRHFAPRAS